MSVTLAMSLNGSGWLKAVAPQNISRILVTLAMLHGPISSLNRVLQAKSLRMLVTWLVSHASMGPCRAIAACLPSASLQYRSTASASVPLSSSVSASHQPVNAASVIGDRAVQSTATFTNYYLRSSRLHRFTAFAPWSPVSIERIPMLPTPGRKHVCRCSYTSHRLFTVGRS